MAEIRTVTTLVHKRDQIASAITAYERQLAQARSDLAHVNAVIKLFEIDPSTEIDRPYTDIHRVFRRGEMITLCKEALASGPKTTRELAQHVMASKGIDGGDKVLAKAVAYRLIHALRQQAKRGALKADGMRGNVRVWASRPALFPSDVQPR